MNPSEIAERLGVPFDDAMWQGSRQSDPLIPRTNRWWILAAPGQIVDDGIEELLARIAPVGDRLLELDRSGEAATVMQVVRSFDDEDGIDEDLSDLGGFRRLGGQHQLLGFHLDLKLMKRLVDLGLELDVDEVRMNLLVEPGCIDNVVARIVLRFAYDRTDVR